MSSSLHPLGGFLSRKGPDHRPRYLKLTKTAFFKDPHPLTDSHHNEAITPAALKDESKTIVKRIEINVTEYLKEILKAQQSNPLEIEGRFFRIEVEGLAEHLTGPAEIFVGFDDPHHAFLVARSSDWGKTHCHYLDDNCLVDGQCPESEAPYVSHAIKINPNGPFTWETTFESEESLSARLGHIIRQRLSARQSSITDEHARKAFRSLTEFGHASVMVSIGRKVYRAYPVTSSNRENAIKVMNCPQTNDLGIRLYPSATIGGATSMSFLRTGERAVSYLNSAEPQQNVLGYLMVPPEDVETFGKEPVLGCVLSPMIFKCYIIAERRFFKADSQITLNLKVCFYPMAGSDLPVNTTATVTTDSNNNETIEIDTGVCSKVTAADDDDGDEEDEGEGAGGDEDDEEEGAPA